MERALITGATGLVGCGLARQLLTDGVYLTALVRGENDASARKRLLTELEEQFVLDGFEIPRDLNEKLTVIATDISSRESVLSVQDKLTNPIDTFWHSAACVNFVDAIQCNAVNIDGSSNVLALAKSVKPQRYNHFSTAFIAGGYKGTIREDEMPPRETLNAYEDTKYQSELNLRNQSDVPFTVLRPSIIVGNRKDGKIRTFKNFYLIVKYIAKMAKKNRTIPRFPDLDKMMINLVPLDFVVETSLKIGNLPSTGKTYNIVNASPPHIGMVVKSFETATGVRVMEPTVGDAKSQEEAELVKARFSEFMPYFFGSPSYELKSMEDLFGDLSESTLPMENLIKLVTFFIENVQK